LTEHCVYLEIFMDPVVLYVPRCIQNGTESHGLEADHAHFLYLML
jgi:hypothetical protein